MVDLVDLKAKAIAATSCDLDTAEIVRSSPNGEIDCPLCSGEGYITGVIDYCNIDSFAVGVEFYGVGHEPEANEAYFRAAKPAVVLELIERLQNAEAQRDELLSALIVAREYVYSQSQGVNRLARMQDQALIDSAIAKCEVQNNG